MSTHDENAPRAPGVRDPASERRQAGDSEAAGSTESGSGNRNEGSRSEDEHDRGGVRHDPALRNAERLERLGNEEEKPADDRYGE